MRGYLAGDRTPKPRLDCSKDPMLTEQHHKDEVDVTTIVRRFGLTGQMPKLRVGGVYGDFSGITDYESAREALERADDGFLALEPEVRARFGNSTAQFLRYADHDPEEFERRMQGPGELVPAAGAAEEAGGGGSPPAGT